MAVRRLRGSWWADFMFRKKRYRFRSPINTKSGAKEYELSMRLRLAQGLPPVEKDGPKQGTTFRDFAAKWYEIYVVANNRKSEQDSKRLYLRKHLMPVFGDMLLEDISLRDIEAYKAMKLQAGQSPKSINNQVGVLSKCLRTAVEWGELNGAPPMRKLKESPPFTQVLSASELSRLLEAAKDSLWHPMILLAARTGLRFGELSGLEWGDIDLEGRKLTVRRSLVKGHAGPPKNGRIREVPLSAEAHVALLGIVRAESPAVFHQDGRPISRSAGHRAITQLCQAAGIKHIGWHTLRHTCATQLANADINLRKVQKILGHSDIRMTERYTHLYTADLVDAVNLLDRINGDKSGVNLVSTHENVPALAATG